MIKTRESLISTQRLALVLTTQLRARNMSQELETGFLGVLSSGTGSPRQTRRFSGYTEFQDAENLSCGTPFNTSHPLGAFNLTNCSSTIIEKVLKEYGTRRKLS